MASDPRQGETLPDTQPASRAADARTAPALGDYELGDVIGRGGMGEVLLATDRELGREVAIKRMLVDDPSGDARLRFVREARVQARLDHPAIVPVHELGYDSDGRPYFTMKRLAGTTLHELIAGGRESLQRLLRAYADVCLAIELAHSKSIVHRDLKPANIMLGDFGEVYVLDWGIARVLGEPEDTLRDAPQTPRDGETVPGTLLGTPGYMAPEQIVVAHVGPPADVYALGSILFELLTGEPLHPGGMAALAATVDGKIEMPSHRRPDRAIAPELEAACAAALARDPAARPTARELAERVQRYLDGDRDLDRRRGLSLNQLTEARAALDAGDRALAMRAAGRALALDPESEAAAALVTRLMLEPPEAPPPELTAEVQRSQEISIAQHARGTGFAYLTFIMFVPIVLWNGVTNLWLLAALLALALVSCARAFAISRQPRRTQREMWIYLLGNIAILAMTERVCGPLLIVPAMACMVVMAAMSYPLFAQRRGLVLAATLLGWLAPVALEQIGWLATTWEVRGGAVRSLSQAIDLGGVPTTVCVFGASIVTVAAAGMHAALVSRASENAKRKLVTQAWHLRHLLPVQPADPS